MIRAKKYFACTLVLLILAGLCGIGAGATETMPTATAATTQNTGWSDTGDIDVRINTARSRTPISPYIYGLTAEGSLSDVKVYATRHSGAELSSYNWETNFSNSGINNNNANNISLIRGYSEEDFKTPALNTQMLITKAGRNNIPAVYVTLQMMGFVAADSDGAVYPDEIYDRFNTVSFSKVGDYLSVPDIDDEVVYMDEYVSYLTNLYGRAAAGGINGYFLDYEPELWEEFYPVLNLPPITADSLISNSIELSSAVKKIDRSAFVLGPSVSGLSSYVNLNNSADRDSYLADHSWFIDYYLDSMKAASDEAGVRLLDVLDLHYITEANDLQGTPVVGSNTVFSNAERMQATRLLWDGRYTENSVSAIRNKAHTPIIPTLLASIRMYYPGTKLSFSEYNFGGGSHISGAIAQADALGIFAKYGVYMACLKPNTVEFPYQKSAINLYTNYDGEGSTFGNTMVESAIRSELGVDNMSSVYASISGADDRTLKTILINKNSELSKTANIRIDSSATFDSAEVYSINSRSFDIRKSDFISDIENNNFSYELEPLTIYLFVFGTDGTITSSTDYIVTPAIVQTQTEKPTAPEDSTETLPPTDANGDYIVTPESPEVTNIGIPHEPSGELELPLIDDDTHIPLALKIIIAAVSVSVLVGIVYVFATDIIARK